MIGPYPENQVLDLLTDLATTPGPSLGEAPRRGVLRAFFEEHGLAPTVDDAGNLWVGVGDGPWPDALVLDAHMDVVERGFVEAVSRDGDRLLGLGLRDNLSSVALLALAMVRLHQEQGGPARPVKAVFTVGEEGLGDLKGIRQVVADHAEPPWLLLAFDLALGDYSIAALGSVRCRVTLTGRGGHSWGDYGTPSATAGLVRLLAEVAAAHQRLAEKSEEPLSYNLGTMHGGEGVNSIARHAEAVFEFRSPSPDLLAVMEKESRVLCDTRAKLPGCNLSLEVVGRRPAANPVHPERIEPVIVELYGGEQVKPRRQVVSTNINAALAAGWSAACVGLAGGGRCHTEDEYLEIPTLATGWRLIGGFLARLAGGET